MELNSIVVAQTQNLHCLLLLLLLLLLLFIIVSATMAVRKIRHIRIKLARARNRANNFLRSYVDK
jgi:hypothetical protein